MPPKRTSTSEAPAMIQTAIRKLVADSVAAALEARAATMASTNNPNRNTEPTRTPIARKGNYKEFISCQPFYFNGKQNIVPELRPRKMEDEFYHLTMKGNDLKAYVGHADQELIIKRASHGINLHTSRQVTCHVCGKKAMLCANLSRRPPTTMAQGEEIPYMADRHAHQDPNVVTGMFLLNQHLARVLFDSGADKSFVSISLASMLNIPPITIDTFYNIKMADGNLVSTNTVIQGATLTLLNQPFEIDLMPIKLGSFDVVIGMDWLSKYHARIICDEKVIHIPINGETLIIRVMEKKLDEKRLEDISVVREFLKVFPEDLPGLPLIRQVEFQINLIPGMAPVARAPYRLDPSEMQELSNQL
ncbi:putative reverse transcriptase domain-containing protein [Tanacetum coccineum]